MMRWESKAVLLGACALLAFAGPQALAATSSTRVAALAQQLAQASPDPGSSAGAGANQEPVPDILYEVTALPPPVQRLREQLLEAARSGAIERLRPILEGNGMTPTFSFGGDTDPIAYWKESSGDGEGREILSILIEVLEAGFVRAQAGTPDEVFVWPYFAQVPIDKLTPPQEVELYKLVTAQDRRDMEEFGAYIFYRVGITPDGQWQFFVAGD